MLGAELANSVFELLRAEIPLNEYNKYIKQISYNEKESKENLSVFTVPNKLILNWIKTRYGSKLSHLFEIKSNVKHSIAFTIKENRSEKAAINTKNLEIKKNSILNPSYNFDNFIVGNSNRFAFSTAKTIANKPGIVYNPVFIYGPTGLGKTHLIHAIGNYAQSRNKIVIYATCEQFVNDYIHHLRNDTMDKFRDKYRSCDILMIDDVQFFQGKVGTQEVFFHTFNELHTMKKQIVLTSDKPPKIIDGIEERLKTRFEWGIIADISIPELETKIAIIKKKCELDKVDLTDDTVNYIASNMGDNIREIESAIININAYANLMRQEITLEFAKNVIKDQIREKHENINIDDIIYIVAKNENIKPSEIKSKNRSQKIVEARRIVIYLSRVLTPNSMPSIASFFGMKDHTAVSHNMKKISELIQSSESFRLKVDELKNKILKKVE
ncbi:MAG: chromosomal replication initiator protein DnaA [Campylobacteraceae bacterium]|jgi:chromosomal replication initiator protein|nr:chromosomal replication initiator protein DnaA [Campylobacteraceae bacterium]